MKLLSKLASHPLSALAIALALALVVIGGNLGGPGLWEPQELAVADRAVLQIDREDPTTEVGKSYAAMKASQPPPAPIDNKGCERTIPEDASARTLSNRATKWGIATFGLSDFGMRAPFALLGILCVLAIFGIGWRLANAKAGLISAVVALSFPILVLSSKQLTSEIGGATGGALIVYGVIALIHPKWRITTVGGIVDRAVSAIAVAAGAQLAFWGSGMLLGVLPPLGAAAACGGFGVPVLQAGIAKLRRRGDRDAAPAPLPTGWLPILLATAATGAVVYILTKQLYDLRSPVTGGREIFGKSIVPSGCYSWALGAIWLPEDNLRNTFESSVEQIAYGTMPWGIAAPLACILLLQSSDLRQRHTAILAVAWAAGGWIATEAFQRKVGFTIYAAFPAIAVVLGVWIESLVTNQKVQSFEAARPHDDNASATTYLGLVALFVALGMIVVAKDTQQFPERLASILVGNDGVRYPKEARLLFVPTKVWVVALGALLALSSAALIVGRAVPNSSERGGRRNPVRGALQWVRSHSATLVLSVTAAIALFWSFGWHLSLSRHLSSKDMFTVFRDLRMPGDRLMMFGDIGNAPRYYADATIERIGSYQQLFEGFEKPSTPRIFAIVPGSDLCAVHNVANGRPYFVLDDTNARSLLLSNQVTGTTDKNPLARAVLRNPPPGIESRPEGRIIYNNSIEVIGWSIPKQLERGSRIAVTVFYKVLAPIAGSYKVFMHFDGGGIRFNGDHDPIGGRCATSFWKPGDYIVDTFSVDVGGSTFPDGKYDVWFGFFSGSSPNWRNMPVTTAPSGSRDNAERVRLLKVELD